MEVIIEHNLIYRRHWIFIYGIMIHDNEVVSMNNGATDLKGYQEAAKHFMKNCYSVGIIYENR